MEVTVPLGDITQYLEQIISDNVASCNLEADSVSLLAYGKGRKGKVKETCQMHDPEKRGRATFSFVLLRTGHLSVATRRFVRVQLARPQVVRWPQAAR